MKVAALIVVVVLVAGVAGVVWLHTPDRPRAALEARYLNGPGDYLDVAGLRLHGRDSGSKDGPVVVMLHGFGASLHTWEPWAQALGDQFRVIRFDLPGFGLTGADPTGDYTDARSVAVLAALLDRLGVARASLIGNSLGGKIAWSFAVEHPERVDRLVLIAPDGFASPGIEYGKQAQVPAMVRLMRYVLPQAMLRSSLVPAYGDPATLTDALATRYYELVLAPGVRDAMIARMEQVRLEDPEPLLRQIQAPTLLLWGEEDGMIPVANAQDYLRDLPNAQLQVLPGLGHVPHEEAPEVALAPVRTFLAGG